MDKSFNAIVDGLVLKTEERMLGVLRNSIKEVIEDAQTPVAKGGKMPVDTGFLRHSWQVGLNVIPSGETLGRDRKPGEVGVLPEYSTEDKADYVLPTLAKMKLGDVFYFGWTAVYAAKQEAYKGFLSSALMKWNEIVNNQVRRLKK